MSTTTEFRLVFITDRQPHSTVRRRWPSWCSRRCSCLEQSAWTRHLRTIRGCLPVPSETHLPSSYSQWRSDAV